MMKSRLQSGLLAALVSGIVLGVVLQMLKIQAATGAITPVITAFGELVGHTNSDGTGWLVQVAASLIAGALFALTVARKVFSYKSALGYGALFGVASWVVGALIAVPHAVDLAMLTPITSQNYFDFAGYSFAAYLLSGMVMGAVYRKLHTDVKVSKSTQQRQPVHA